MPNLTDPEHRPQSVARLVLAIAVFAALVSSCAMPTDAEPEGITLSEEAEELLQPAPPSTTTTVAETEPTLPRLLWFIADDELSREEVQIGVSSANDLTAILNRLAEGTTQQDHRSAIPDAVVFTGYRTDDSDTTVTIELADAALFEIDGSELARAVAQIVFTATQPALGFEQVRLEIDGTIRSVPVGAGSNSSEPVDRCDYERFDPSPSCPESVTDDSDDSDE